MTAAAVAGGGGRDVREHLTGYEETPAISTTGSGRFRAQVNQSRIEYKLSYADLEDDVTQAHIHFGQEGSPVASAPSSAPTWGTGPRGRRRARARAMGPSPA